MQHSSIKKLSKLYMHMLASKKETTKIAMINYYFRINESSELTF